MLNENETTDKKERMKVKEIYIYKMGVKEKKAKRAHKE